MAKEDFENSTEVNVPMMYFDITSLHSLSLHGKYNMNEIWRFFKPSPFVSRKINKDKRLSDTRQSE